ncbi:MAG: putative Ig domain-containing protein [Gemmatimonadota bacterium]|nr:putative Ig domain-containing protein [Gemmatimonadota bacterium]
MTIIIEGREWEVQRERTGTPPPEGLTLRGDFQPIRPNATYHVLVAHDGFDASSAEISVTTPAAPPAGAQGSARTPFASGSATRAFVPDWPVAITEDHYVTDDPFDWRGTRYHAGLDIGSVGVGEAIRGAAVVASAGGILRVFNDAWPTVGEQGANVLYWPGIKGLFHTQFIASEKGSEENRGGQPCYHVVTAYSGRTALIFHSNRYVTKYAHLTKGSIPTGLLRSLDRDGDGYADPDAWVSVTRGQTIGTVGASGFTGEKPVIQHVDDEGNAVFKEGKPVLCHSGDGCYSDDLTLADGRHCDRRDRRLKSEEARNEADKCFDEAVAEASDRGVIKCEPGAPCAEAFTDPHLHYEIRRFDENDKRSPSKHWYSAALRCAGAGPDEETTEEYCEYTSRRELPTVLNPEKLFRPLPASVIPRDPGKRDEIQSAAAEADRRWLEVTGVSVRSQTGTSLLTVDLSIAFWRPAFYAGDTGNWPRSEWHGIRGTQPGVSAYYTDLSCASSRGLRAPGLITGDRKWSGELPRQSRTAQLAMEPDHSCQVAVLTANPSYPAPIFGPPYVGSSVSFSRVSRLDVSAADPEATLVFVTELEAGGQEIRKTLAGIDFHFYSFQAIEGLTYEFCAKKPDNVCMDEGAHQGVVFELWQGKKRLELSDDSGQVANIRWEAPASGTYFLVVRGDYPKDYPKKGKTSPIIGPYTLHYDLACVLSFPTKSVSYDFQVGSPVDQKLPEAICADGLPSYELFLLLMMGHGGASGSGSASGSASASASTAVELPLGLSYDAAERRISGTPTAVTAEQTYTFRATDDADQTAELDVTIEVTAAASVPSVTITAGTSPIEEDADAKFTIRRTGDTSDALVVQVDVTESGAMFDGMPPETVEIEEGSLTGTLTVEIHDDDVDEADSVVTAEITSGTGYTVGATATATVTVQDNDPDPPARYLLTLSPPTNGSLSATPDAPAGGYLSGTSVIVTATPNSGYEIESWGGACATTGADDTTCDLTMDATKTVSVTFAAKGTDPPPTCPSPRPKKPKTMQDDTTYGTPSWTSPSNGSAGGTTYQKRSVTSQPQIRSVTWWGPPDCEWDEGEWKNDGKPSTTVETLGSKTVGKQPKTEMPVDLTDSEAAASGCGDTRSRTGSRTDTRSGGDWNSSTGNWNPTGEWEEGTETWGGWVLTLKRPEKPKSSQSLTTTYTRWVVRGDTAYEQSRTSTQWQVRSVSWSGETECEWETGIWFNFGNPVWTSWKDTGGEDPKPATKHETRETQLSSWTAWEVVGPAVFGCLWQQYRYVRYQLEHWSTTSYWGGSSWVEQWGLSFVLGEGTRKTAVGNPTTFACPSSASAGGASGASGDAASARTIASASTLTPAQYLLAGDYVYTWGTTHVSFTVPADARIDLAWRVLESGVRAAVLTDGGAGEVLVYPGAAAARDARGSDGGPDTRSATLQSIETSLREAQAATARTAAAESSPCAPVSSGGAAAAAIDLDAGRCAAVPSGGAVTITVDGSLLALTLTADREWLVARLGAAAAGGPERVGLLDIASSSLLLLHAASGAEVERRIPDGAETGIGALLDAIVTSVSRSDAPAGGDAPGSDGPTGAQSADPQPGGASTQQEGSAAAAADTAEAKPCTVASSNGSAAAIDLTAGGCASVVAGGPVRITVGEDVLSLTLTADRDWDVALVGADDDPETQWVVLLDTASMSFLLLDPASGEEAERRIPDAAATVGPIFDAIATSAAATP